MFDTKDQVAVEASATEPNANPGSDPQPKQGYYGVAPAAEQSPETSEIEGAADQIEGKKGRWAYFKTKEFYITLLLGFVAVSPYLTR